jgi:tetratricopeptide (TPR) repeat protein
MARILAWRSLFRTYAWDLQTSERLLRESRALLDGPALADVDTRFERAYISWQSGYSYSYSDPAKARQHFAQGLELYRQIGHKLGTAHALLALGRAGANLGALEEAREAMTQSVSLHRDMGNPVAESESVAELGAVVAIRQFRFQEAEDLIQQSLSLAPETNRFGIAYGLGQLCQVQLLTGQFAEAETSSMDCASIFEDLGLRVMVLRYVIHSARARLHAGECHTARDQAEAIVSLAHEASWVRGVSYGKIVLGEVALAKAAYAQSYQILQESLADLKQVTDDPWDVNQSAWLGLAARGLERRQEAWHHLVSTLDWASKHHQFHELMVALAGIALLLADEGEAERAVELYALASRYPFVANSAWFEDVIGRHISASTAELPPDVVAAAQERGRARVLADTLAELLAEFGS